MKARRREGECVLLLCHWLRQERAVFLCAALAANRLSGQHFRFMNERNSEGAGQEEFESEREVCSIGVLGGHAG